MTRTRNMSDRMVALQAIHAALAAEGHAALAASARRLIEREYRRCPVAVPSVRVPDVRLVAARRPARRTSRARVRRAARRARAATDDSPALRGAA